MLWKYDTCETYIHVKQIYIIFQPKILISLFLCNDYRFQNQKSLAPDIDQSKIDTHETALDNDIGNDSSTNETHQKNSSKECKECGKVYKTNYKLLQHMRKHTGEKPFKCGTCDKTFRSKIGLAQHEAKHTGNNNLS